MLPQVTYALTRGRWRRAYRMLKKQRRDASVATQDVRSKSAAARAVKRVFMQRVCATFFVIQSVHFSLSLSVCACVLDFQLRICTV